jgi:hypothetical protein
VPTLLAGRAEESAEKNIKESLKALKFLPHEAGLYKLNPADP